MKGQFLFRKTSHKNHRGEEVFVVVGVVVPETHDNIKDGHKYDILDIALFNGEDFSELSNVKSPEDLLESKIWKT